MTGHTYFLLALVLLTTAAACDARPADVEEDTTPTVTIRDSAGIEIVENHAPKWAGANFWSVDPEPVIVIGGDLGGVQAAEDSVHLGIGRIGGRRDEAPRRQRPAPVVRREHALTHLTSPISTHSKMTVPAL